MKFNKLLFGTAGIPTSTPERNTINGIKQVKKLGLESMEIEFVRSVNVSSEVAPVIKKTAEQEGITLTCHGQYFVNLNGEKATVEASKKRILEACRRCEEAGVWSICYHIAYYMKQDPEKVYKNVKKNVKEIVKILQNEGIKLWLRPETGGKISQFGDLKELIKLSQDVEQVLPCIDWAHHHSRSLGKFNTYKEFAYILEEIEKGLGKEALQKMHCHAEGIRYGDTGEREHLNLKESDMNYKDMIKAWKDFKIKGVITCESPNIEEDALMMKKIYEGLK